MPDQPDLEKALQDALEHIAFLHDRLHTLEKERDTNWIERRFYNETMDIAGQVAKRVDGLEKERDALVALVRDMQEALTWYYEDDMRAAEQGILEAATLRPAAALLTRVAAQAGASGPLCADCGAPALGYHNRRQCFVCYEHSYGDTLTMQP